MIRLSIVCDVCGEVGTSGSHTRAHLLRVKLKEQGWRVGKRGGADYCLDCWRKRRAGKQMFLGFEKGEGGDEQ